MVSGRLGWNALYWATAPGLHFPCAGGAYPDQQKQTPDSGSAPNCSGTGQETSVNPTAAAGQVASVLRGLGAPLPPPVENAVGTTNAAGLLPFVIASGAGGTFGPDGQSDGAASDGYWHGYTIAEVTCPTKYFAEASSINLKRSIKYGLGCVGTAIKFRLCRWGLIRSPLFPKAGGGFTTEAQRSQRTN